ncbi:MAG: alanine dehydrogenase, partial [Atribacterota bacterium]|nr:alanine dehydrogenase [Atribacterota bacterium]
MIIGIPKEIKNNENRVAITPAGVRAFTQSGHKVLVQKAAGLGSGISDREYSDAGASIQDTAEKVFGQSDMIMKVKEPMPVEYPMIKPGQIVSTYFHFAASLELTEGMVNRRCV